MLKPAKFTAERSVRSILLLFLLSFLIPGFAQTYHSDSLGMAAVWPKINHFEHLSVKDGLSNNSVNCILQDREGFIWFGTNDGLNKYDGYTFTVLQADLDKPDQSFQNNRISGLCEDHKNRLWAVTEGGGLHEIDKQTGRVTSHLIQTKNAGRWNNQHSVYEDRQGILWLGTYGGLARYDPDRHQFTLYPSPQPDMPIKTVFEDRQQRFWVATLRGLYLLDRATGRFVLMPTFVSAGPQPTFISFYLDAQEVLWLGTSGHGLFQINLRRQPFQLVPYNPGGHINSYVFLNSIHRDAGGMVWVGTTDGLQRIDPVSQQVFTYLPNPNVPKGISSNSAQAVYHDRAGTLWVGTDNGIDRQATYAKPFRTYQVTPNTSTVNLSKNKVTTLLVDSRNRLWFSNQWTIYRTNLQTNRLEAVLPGHIGAGSLNKSDIHTLLPNGPAGVWVSTWNSLYYVDQATGQHVEYPSEVHVEFISRGKANNLWIGGEGGIAHFDTRTHQYTYYTYKPGNTNGLPDRYVHGLLVSRTGDVWVLVKKQGVCRLNPKTGQFTQYNAGSKGQLNTNEVQAIYEDANGIIWLGTHQGGLNRFDPQTEKFSSVTVRDGLPSNSIVGIIADGAGHIWLSTNKGICRYDPRTKTVRSYGVNDGLPSNDFLQNAVFRQNNQLFFGSLNGVVYFNPDSIRDDRRPFPVHITGFNVLNKPRPLTNREIILNHDENFLSFEFAALTYVLPDKNQYAYQLVGVDKNWVQSANNRFANYPDLSPGHYTFRVKASNSDGVWNRKEASVRFVILPPWWATWWAYSVYALLAAGVVFGGIRFYTNRIRQQQEMELNRREAKQLKAVDELKTRFFSNITHEFRTPLSLIISPVEKLVQDSRFDTPTRQTLGLIQRNANQLLRLINQLLDLSKLEANSMTVSLKRGDVPDFVEQLVNSFQQAADQKNITLVYTSESLPHEYLFDTDKWEKILTNLLSNALKFTGTGGSVAVTLKPTASTDGVMSSIQIAIADTGIGIPAEKLPHIFDRFYQVDDSRTRAYEGTGIGLALVKELIELVNGTIAVESQPNEGTRFQLMLPVRPASAADVDVPSVAPVSKPLLTAIPFVEQIPAQPDLQPVGESDIPLLLVVEDNTELREFLASELAATYRVLRAANGEEGWQLAQAELPDIVISDVMMPKMDGYELTERIKKQPDTNHIAVVLLTAKTAQHSRIEGLEKGADDYLSKPFNVDELHLRLRNLIAHQQKLRDHYRRQLAQPEMPISLETVQDTFLQQVYELLGNHLDDTSLNVDWLADQLAMSRKTLYRKVHSLTQLAPNELIRNYRLRRAADLLRAGNNATETAYMVGFKTPSHFSIVFKEFYQQTPTEFAANDLRDV